MGNRFREKVTEEGLENETVVKQSEPEVSEPTDETIIAEEVSTPEADANVTTARKSSRAAKGFAKVLGGDILADKLVLRQIPLMLLCLFFLLLLVANRYRVESLSRERIATLERINDLREQRIQMQKQYQESVKISHIAEDLQETGVGITSGPPYEIED